MTQKLPCLIFTAACFCAAAIGAPPASQQPGDDLLAEKLRKNWVEVNGKWSFADGKLTGSGDSRINYTGRIRVPFVLSYDFEVKEGMRPRVYIGKDLRIANEGYKHQIDLYPQMKTEPVPYELKRKHSVKFVVNRRFMELYLDGKLLTRRDTGMEDAPELFGFCGGDGYSPGMTEFSNIRLE